MTAKVRLMDFAASPFEIKQLNDSGSIEGLLAGFGDVDTHGDRIDAKAFAKTLAARGERPLPMLLYHDQHRPCGSWRSWQETSDGLYVKGGLTLETRDGQEARALARDGALTGLSVGFNRARRRPSVTPGVRDLLEADLHEGSLVTIASNDRTRILSIKAIAGPRDLEDLLREGGVSGRKAKTAASLAWKSINDTDDDASADAALVDLFTKSAARIASL